MIDQNKIYNATELLALSIDDLTEGAIKYVRVGNEYRFCKVSFCGGLSHKNLVKAGEAPISAGVIGINSKHISLIDNHSETLHIGEAADDGEQLSKLFNRPFKTRWD